MDEGEGGEIDVVENSSVPNTSSAKEATIVSFARKLRAKYPQLMIHNSVAPKDGTKFLHIWKLSKKVGQTIWKKCLLKLISFLFEIKK